MGRKFKFAKTEYQYSGGTAKPKYMVIEFLPEQVGELVYSGEELFPTWKNLDPLKVTIEGEKSAVNAGKHYITVTPTGNFAWSDMTQRPVQIEYEIKRKPVANVPSQKGRLTYNKYSQSAQWNDYSANELTISGTTSATYAGTYTATFTPDDNHCWSDGTFAAKNVSWTIEKLLLAKPTAPSKRFTYTGKLITLQVDNFDADFMEIISGTTATNVGSYQAAYALRNNPNIAWKDGTTDYVYIPWSIKAKTFSFVTKKTNSFTYDGDLKTFEFNNFDEDYMTVSGATSATNAGNYTVSVALKDKVNTAWSNGSVNDIELTFYIYKATVSVPSLPKDDYPTYDETKSYDPEDLPWQNYDDEIMTCTGDLQDQANELQEAYTATFALTNNNYQFPGGFQTATKEWRINRKVLDEKYYPKLNDAWEEVSGDTYTDYYNILRGKTAWQAIDSAMANFDSDYMEYSGDQKDTIVEGGKTYLVTVDTNTNYKRADGKTQIGRFVLVVLQMEDAPAFLQVCTVPYGKDPKNYYYTNSDNITVRTVERSRADAAIVYYVLPDDWEIKEWRYTTAWITLGGGGGGHPGTNPPSSGTALFVYVTTVASSSQTNVKLQIVLQHKTEPQNHKTKLYDLAILNLQ